MSFKGRHQLRGLLPRAGHHDSLTKQRPLLKPVEGITQADHITYNNQGRRLDRLFLNLADNGLKSGDHGMLFRS